MLGRTIKTILLMAPKLGLSRRGLGLEQLKELKLSAILHWDMNHFVVLAGVKGGRLAGAHTPATQAAE